MSDHIPLKGKAPYVQQQVPKPSAKEFAQRLIRTSLGLTDAAKEPEPMSKTVAKGICGNEEAKYLIGQFNKYASWKSRDIPYIFSMSALGIATFSALFVVSGLAPSFSLFVFVVLFTSIVLIV